MFKFNGSIPLTSRPNSNENYFDLGYENDGKFVIVARYKIKEGLPVFL